jgi:hypothetical protein
MKRLSIKNAFMVFAVISSLLAFALLMLNYNRSAGLERVLGSIAIFIGIEITLAMVIGRHFARRAEPYGRWRSEQKAKTQRA